MNRFQELFLFFIQPDPGLAPIKREMSISHTREVLRRRYSTLDSRTGIGTIVSVMFQPKLNALSYPHDTLRYIIQCLRMKIKGLISFVTCVQSRDLTPGGVQCSNGGRCVSY